MPTSTADQIRATVREAYGAVASQQQHGGCCTGSGGTSCCGPTGTASTRLGYTETDVELHGNRRAFIARRVQNQADVDDLVQRVLLQIVTGLHSLRCRIDLDRRNGISAYTPRHPDACGCGGCGGH